MRSLAVVALVAACGGPADRPADAADAAGPGDASLDAADASVDARPLAPLAITDDHRYVPGAMFGGWGPHLGHLIELGVGADRALTWIDDHCDQQVPGDCDVNVDRRLMVVREGATGWQPRGQVPLPATIQQNTATIADGATAWTFGIDSGARRVVECRHGAAASCAAIPIDIGASANYVGAAITPAGWRLVWWTNVVDGGGGSFSFLVDYGGGWNGPRTGAIAGYNDCAYAHVAFAPAGDAATFFCQVVSGQAPAWSFATLVGEARLATAAPVAWTAPLRAPAGDPIASTNDLWIDPATGDAHLVARSAAGAAVYYHRPAGGAWSAPIAVLASTFRARWLVTPTAVALVTGPGGGGLRVLAADRAAVVVGQPLALTPRLEVPLPGGQVQAIYPLAAAYQRPAPTTADVVVVVADQQSVALHLAVGW